MCVSRTEEYEVCNIKNIQMSCVSYVVYLKQHTYTYNDDDDDDERVVRVRKREVAHLPFFIPNFKFGEMIQDVCTECLHGDTWTN